MVASFACKSNSTTKLLILILAILAIVEPWFYINKYNPDLLVLIRYVNFDLPTEWSESLFNNTLYLYAAKSIFSSFDSFKLIIFLQNFAVILLTCVLSKVVRPTYLLSFMLISFYTIYLNQFRMATSIAFCVMAYTLDSRSFLYRTLLMVIAVFLHIFSGLWFLLLLISEYIVRKKFRYIFMLLFFLILSVFLYFLYNENSSDVRYLEYFQVSDSASYSFVLPLAIFPFLASKLNTFHRIVGFFILTIAISTYQFSSVSGRISELACMTYFIFASRDSAYSILIESKRNCKMLNLACNFAILGIGLMFFAYRFYSWVILDNVKIPDEILQ